MCDSVAFHAQLASIIEVLANAAVAEICKLVDDGHAALRMEISHSQKEIDNLRRKLVLTKYQSSQRGTEKFGALRRTVHRRDTDLVARARASFVGKSSGRHGYLENRSNSEGDNFTKDVTNWNDARRTATDPDGSMRMADMQESPLIKMENLGSSRTEEIVQPVSESSEKIIVAEPGSSSSTEPTDLDQQGNRHRAPDTSLNIEPENQTFQHPASQYNRTRQDHQVAEGVTWETDHQPIEYSLSHWTENQETDNPTVNAPHDAGPDSKRLSEHPERRGVTGNSGVSMSASGSLDWLPDVVLVDSVPIKVEADMSSEWSITGQEVTSGEVCSDGRQLVDNRGRGGMESGQTKCPPNTQHAEQGTTVGPRSKFPDFNGLSTQNSFSSPSVTLLQVPQRGKPAPFLNFNRGYNFSSKSKEKQAQQLTSHSPKRQLRCSLCGKPFPQPAQLRSHMRVHTGEKPYGCSHCTKRFSHRHQLKMHERVHTGEKPFHCVYCGKCFTQSSHMKRHLLVHTGGRPQDTGGGGCREECDDDCHFLDIDMAEEKSHRFLWVPAHSWPLKQIWRPSTCKARVLTWNESPEVPWSGETSSPGASSGVAGVDLLGYAACGREERLLEPVSGSGTFRTILRKLSSRQRVAALNNIKDILYELFF